MFKKMSLLLRDDLNCDVTFRFGASDHVQMMCELCVKIFILVWSCHWGYTVEGQKSLYWSQWSTTSGNMSFQTFFVSQATPALSDEPKYPWIDKTLVFKLSINLLKLHFIHFNHLSIALAIS